jgi:signal transduction histidine kinase
MKSARIFQLTALLLVVVSVFQVCWWLIDQRGYTQAKALEERMLYTQQLGAAQALLDAGVAAGTVQELLPNVAVNGRRAALSAAVSSKIAAEQRRRNAQYLWEGSFFLLALCTCIGVIWMALRAETQVLKEHDNFLALVSHQFKTPLASLQLSLETMTLRELAPDQSRALIQRMLADLTRMETMVSQILDSARLERGRVDLKREPVLLATIVAHVVANFQDRAAKDHIRIETDIAEGLQVLADPLAVDVVVRNLIENALAAVAPVGGGRILVAAQRQGSEVQLAVRDSGVGFLPADEMRLFEKFSRLNPGAGSSYYGTGLGLYIVKRLMQLLGGKVTAHSEGVGRGAEFVLTWPVALETA